MIKVFCAYSVMLLVFLGGNVTATPSPNRIVSASLASDEILLELLKSKTDRERILAVSYLADNPEYSSVVDDISDIPKRFTTSVETTVSLRPDLLILASYNDAKFKRAFEKFKIPYIELLRFNSIQDISKNIQAIGKSIKKEEQSKILAQRFLTTIRSLSARYKTACPKPVKLLPYSATSMLAGKNTLFDSLASQLGVMNLGASTGLRGWNTFGLEQLVKLEPDWIILSSKKEAHKIKSQKGWKWLEAVNESRFIFVPNSLMSSTSQYLAKTLKSIAYQLCPKLTKSHPHAIKSQSK